MIPSTTNNKPMNLLFSRINFRKSEKDSIRPALIYKTQFQMKKLNRKNAMTN